MAVAFQVTAQQAMSFSNGCGSLGQVEFLQPIQNGRTSLFFEQVTPLGRNGLPPAFIGNSVFQEVMNVLAGVVEVQHEHDLPGHASQGVQQAILQSSSAIDLQMRRRFSFGREIGIVLRFFL